MEIVSTNALGLERAVSVLETGGVVVVPTDTVYGLAARIDCPQAVERLYAIKGRAAKKPIALLAADVSAARRICGASFSGDVCTLAERVWPGALTIVAGGEGVRVPDHAWTRALLARCGGCLRVTSANLSGQREATDVPQALADVGLSADLVVDGGVSPGGMASTVVKAESEGAMTVLRPGPKSVLRVVMKVMRKRFVSQNASAAKAWQAQVCTQLCTRDEICGTIARHRPIAVYCASDMEVNLSAFIQSALAKGALLVAPRWTGQTYELAVLDSASPADLVQGPHGIWEPRPGTSVLPCQVSVWLVPGLAFSASGARLGYGGGWYDRFLAEAKADALRFGIAWPCQRLDALPCEAHDQLCPLLGV